MFDGEFLVSFEARDAQQASGKIAVQLFADENEVKIPSGTPKRKQPTDGLLRVEVLKKQNGVALLALPQPAQPVGERAYVDVGMLREASM
jgi:hypothetical protein